MSRSSKPRARRSLALGIAAVVVALIAQGCGATSGSSSAPAVVTGTPAGTAALAHATLTLRLPAHVGHARAAQSGRAAAYVNPNAGNVLIVAVRGTSVIDPQNPTNAYFSIPSSTNSDGSVTFDVPLAAGSYNPGDITVSEGDAPPPAGNVLAAGSNSYYTDAGGTYHGGDFIVPPGGTAAFVVTMQMNATRMAITTDPIAGSDAALLSTDVMNPTNFHCISAGTPVYLFPADPSNTFVLPSSTAPGYTGGQQFNAYPGVPTVGLSSWTAPSGTSIAATIFGAPIFIVSGTGVVMAHFQFLNPFPTNYTSVDGYANLGLCLG